MLAAMRWASSLESDVPTFTRLRVFCAWAMRDALALELHQEVKLTTGEKVKKLRLVARTLVDNAIDGDTTAARECFDRMDGKVTPGVDATGQVRGNVTFTWETP